MMRIVFDRFYAKYMNFMISVINLKHFNLIYDAAFRCFCHLTPNQQLIDNSVHLVEIEDDVQFTHVPEILVQGFHQQVDQLSYPNIYFKVEKLVVIEVDAEGKVQASIPLVDDFKVVELHVDWITYKKLVYLELLMTIIRWISDWSLIFYDSS